MIVTVKTPIYIVQKFKSLAHLGEIYYYTSLGTEEGLIYSENKKSAMIFHTLEQADRVARAEEAEIRVITDQKTAKEFGVDE